MHVSKITPKVPAALLLALVIGCLCLAQAPSPASREEVEKTIRAQARQDASRGKQREAGPLIEMFRVSAAAAGIAPNEIVNVYETEYFEAAGAEPWWKGVTPQWGWLAAGVMLLLLVFRDVLKDTLKNGVTVAKDWVYRRISGYRLFRRTALRHYSQALIRRYHLLKIPFRPDQPLNVRDIYVPLKVKGASDAEQVDAFRTMAVTRRIMIVGPPGSGKSMLLKHVALSYADGKFKQLTDRPIPILLELNRLNESSRSIEEHLVDSFDINDFHNARNFIDLGLENGTLMLLFDGLDEVNSSRRELVVKALSDLLHKYPTCRAIITCRTAVYRNEFTEVTDQTLEIVEFTDQQVQSFLSAWHPYMPPGKSIEQLVNTLQARPRIMALARNPLLLTIIAFLYTAPDFVLPDSRTEFYKQAIDVLLRQWKTEANRYKSPQKSIVLQHLALFNQESDAERSQDRRSIDLKTIIEEIKKVLPDLNLDLKEADPLLGEIVERSGLLLQIDGGARYQFAHLTLQEYFAATALSADEEGLLKRFMQDPDAWRETVKLWCGLEQDSTTLVSRIFAYDQITAFECLADAQKISPELADRIIKHFKNRLESDAEVDETVVRAFAAVASGQSMRSQAVFNYLADRLRTLAEVEGGAATEPLRTGIITALALTNKPAAVTVLLLYYDRWPEVRAAIVKMGDLAVNGLYELCMSADVYPHLSKRAYAFQGLMDVGTPKAAAALVPLLWGESHAELAARSLSALFHQPIVLDALRLFSLSHRQKVTSEYSFVWSPFPEDGGTSLPPIAARCAELLGNSATNSMMEDIIRDHDLEFGGADLRLIVPAVIKSGEYAELRIYHGGGSEGTYIITKERTAKPGLGLVSRIDLGNLSRIFRRYLEIKLYKGEIDLTLHSEDYIAAYVADMFEDNESPTRRLIAMLNPFDQVRVLTRLITSARPSLKDWSLIHQQSKFVLERSWQYKVILIMAAIYCLVALYGAGVSYYHDPSSQAAVVGILLILSIYVTAYVVQHEENAFTTFMVFGGTFTMPLFVGLSVIEWLRGREHGLERKLVWQGPLIFLFTALTANFAFGALSSQVGPGLTLVLFALWIALTVALVVWGKQRERKGRNTLEELVDNVMRDDEREFIGEVKAAAWPPVLHADSPVKADLSRVTH